MAISTKLSLVLAALLPFVVASAETEEYCFIVSGYPVKDNCSTLESKGIALETASQTGRSGSSSLESRYRTFVESAGVALRSDKFRFFGIVFR